MPSRHCRIALVAAVALSSLLLAAAGPGEPPPPPAKPDPAATPPAKPEPVKPDPAKPEPAKPDPAAPEAAAPAPPARPYVLDYHIADIDGVEQDLSQWKGKVVLIVNTASKCGYTHQYKGLESLYQSKKDKGLVVLAFPSGDFADQEFGDNAQIKQFCMGDGSEYKVTFPLFGKMHVKGPDAHPLFKQLAGQADPVGGEPKWNFTKWLVDRQGNVVARFDTRVAPDNDEFLRRLDELMSAK